jgi:hypothetical protein
LSSTTNTRIRGGTPRGSGAGALMPTRMGPASEAAYPADAGFP